MIPPIYDMLYTALFSLGALSFAGPYLQLEGITRREYILALFYTAICVGFRHLETKFRLALSASLLCAALLILWLNRSEERFARLVERQGYLWMFFLVIGCFLLQLLLEHFRSLRLPAVLSVFIFLLANLFWGGEPKHFGVCMLLFWALLLFCEITQQGWKKNGYTEIKPHIVYLAPFFLLGLVLILALPTSDKPYDWKIVRNLWNYIQETTYSFSQKLFYRHSDNYQADFLGFSDHGELSGTVLETHDPIMVVTFSARQEEKLYLKGKVFDTFDGQNWTMSNQSTRNERMLDTLETYAAAVACDYYHRTDYLAQEKMEVRFEKFVTQYMFVPSKAVLGSKALDAAAISQKGNDLLFEKKTGAQTEYSLSFYRMNKDNEVFVRLFENSNPCDEQLWQNTARSFSLHQTPGYAYQDYLDYVADIYQYDLTGINENRLSERYRNFMQELFAGTTNDFERLCRLEQFLGTMTYTKTPGALPSDIKNPEDYLDYFLFEKQAGYCSHYATAFVLMARSLEIPSRFVQGFAPVGTGDGSVEIYSGDAHAWAECYFPGVGWLTFDPTPGSRVTSYWLTYAQRQELNTDSYVRPEKPTPELPELPSLPEPDEPEPEAKASFPVYYLALIAGACLLVLAVFLVLDQLLLARHYRKASQKEKWDIAYQKDLRLLYELGFRFTDGETLTEFRQRCAQALPASVLQFLSFEEKYLYAGYSPDTEMGTSAELANRELLFKLKRKSRLRYVLCVLMGMRVWS